ncbi:MAG TPA: hypothetical protein VMV94_00225 [Phycisphaerae bacterium]|nr:hypothetical protein [Phycisphaerae bacterium]
MIVAQSAVLAAVYVTLIPALWRMTTVGKPARLRVGLLAAAARFLLTAAVATVIVWHNLTSRSAFLIWLAITYVVLIKVETWAFIYWSKTLDKRL